MTKPFTFTAEQMSESLSVALSALHQCEVFVTIVGREFTAEFSDEQARDKMVEQVTNNLEKVASESLVQWEKKGRFYLSHKMTDTQMSILFE